MLNILVPLAGRNTFETNKSNVFPKILSEIGGSLLIERAARPFLSLKNDKKIVIAVPKEESEKFRLKNVLTLLSDDVTVCHINGNTQGAACSSLLALESLDLDAPLIISSFEQVLDFSLQKFVDEFIQNNIDAGVLTFDAIHPKWSYVKIDSELNITQAAEKDPISRNAIAGFYFFKTAKIFCEAAQNMIRKDVKTNGLFYIAPVINEIILNKGLVKAIPIDKGQYYHINDEHALECFEEKVVLDASNKQCRYLARTNDYVRAFNSKNLEQIGALMTDSFSLKDPEVNVYGKNKVLQYIEQIFERFNALSFVANSVSSLTDGCTMIEFTLSLNDKTFNGVDIIHWNDDGSMISMNAYLNEAQCE